MDRHEKCLQPPEATGERDLSAEHALTDALFDKTQVILLDKSRLAEAALDAIVSDAVDDWEDAVWGVAHGKPRRMLELIGKAAAWAAAHEQCERCLSVVRHERCAMCLYLDAETGEDPELARYDRESMDRPPGSELDS